MLNMWILSTDRWQVGLIYSAIVYGNEYIEHGEAQYIKKQEEWERKSWWNFPKNIISKLYKMPENKEKEIEENTQI